MKTTVESTYLHSINMKTSMHLLSVHIFFQIIKTSFEQITDQLC